MKKKLAIISTHPIQYNAPMFALLAKSDKFNVKVFYTWSQSQESLFDQDFGKQIQWDIPLLSGYEYVFIENISKKPGPTSYSGIDCPELNQAVQYWNADILLIYGWNFKAHFSAMRFFKHKIPVYFRGDSTLIDETGGLKSFLRRIVLRYVYRFCDGAFYVGKNNKQYFLKHGLEEKQLFFAPHAIDNARFSKSPTTNEVVLAKLNLTEENTVFLFVGKFEPKKNPIILLNAFLSANIDTAHLVFVGNGILENELKQLARSNNRIHFIPFQNQSLMPSIYHFANVLVLPSQGPGETWGLVVNEAMACRKAIIASDKVGCAIDLVQNGKNGYIFQSGNETELSNCIQKIASNKKQCHEMGEFSQEIIKNWSFQEIVGSIEKNI